jgi:pimeloyl-ACP methyl ester carboxylesterase
VIAAVVLALVYLLVAVLVYVNQRSLIFLPSHRDVDTPLRPWQVDDRVIGYCRTARTPVTAWLMTHGNAGQAADRAYVLRHISESDSLYVLEYPGYGLRAGHPSKDSIDAAALEAYDELRREFPGTPIGVIGESIGSGPASFLASGVTPPDKVVLVVPFDTLASVASGHMPFLPVGAMLKDNWDNIQALKAYKGPIDIYGAVDDQIIPVAHAKRLAASLPHARFVAIEGGHNDWSASDRVRIER